MPTTSKEALAAAKRLRGRDLDMLDLALAAGSGKQFDVARQEVAKRIAKRSKTKQAALSVAPAPRRSPRTKSAPKASRRKKTSR